MMLMEWVRLGMGEGDGMTGLERVGNVEGTEGWGTGCKCRYSSCS